VCHTVDFCSSADISVFTGARFNVQTSQWEWSDGTAALFDAKSSITVYQQKVLHYGETWNITTTNCTKTAYYSCQLVPCESEKYGLFMKGSKIL